MQNEPPANFKDRQKWYAGQQRATRRLYPHKKRKPKQKGIIYMTTPRRNNPQ